ncbi:MAG: carbohydrate ABC transporter permease [Acidimicrobiia bacterium]
MSTPDTAPLPTRAPDEPVQRGLTLRQREQRLAWVLVLPAVLAVAGLVIFPVLWNITLSVQRIRLIDLQSVDFLDIDPTIANFSRVTGVRSFWEVIRTTVIYTVGGTVLSIVLGLWAALVVKKVFIGRSVVRGLMLFPYVAPVIAVTFVWRLMLNPTFGIVNEWVDGAGLTRIDFLGRRDIVLDLFAFHLTLPLALTMVILFEAWRYFPFAFLFILARVQALPSELEEAATVDGATLTQRFRYITLPQLSGVLSVLFLLRFIWTFNKFDDIFLLTGGAAGTEVITLSIVDWLLGRGDIGSAAALSIILAGFLFVLLFVYYRFFFTEEVAE